MLIYEHFIFIHMPKTAGTFLTDAFQHQLPPPRMAFEAHTGWDAIPPEAADLPVLMYVRNPWDWYVSWYHFETRWFQLHPTLARDNHFVPLLFGENAEFAPGGMRGVNDFAEAVRSACENFNPRHPLVAEMLRTGHPHAALVAAGDDLYTTRFKYLAGAGLYSEQMTIGRFESLIEDLQRFLAENAVPGAADIVGHLRSIAPSNVGHHEPYSEYYDDALRDLVGRSCRMITQRFGYDF